MQTGLVLEGGGMRAIFEAAVLDVFIENNINFDGVIGVSAGATQGASYITRQIGRNLRYYLKFVHDPRFMSFRNWLRTGNFVGVKFCYHDIPERLDPFDYEAFKNSATKFFINCTNLETALPEYFQITDMRKQIDLVRASASLPYLSRAVRYAGKKLLDGGVVESIPIYGAQRLGFEKNVVILTQHKGFRKKPENRLLPYLFYFFYPKFIKAIHNRHNMYNATVEYLEELERQGRVFIIRPSVSLNIGRLESDTGKMREIYDIGVRDAQNCLERLRQWLQAK